MAPVTHSYIWNRYAGKTVFGSLTKIERQEIMLSIEYSIIFIAVRSWTCLCRLPRSNCPDACQFYVGFPVLFHASYSGVGQSGNEKSYAVTDFSTDGESKLMHQIRRIF